MDCVNETAEKPKVGFSSAEIFYGKEENNKRRNNERQQSDNAQSAK